MSYDDHVEALRSALSAAGSLGEPSTQAIAEALIAAAEPALKNATLAIYDDLVVELSRQLPDHDIHIQIRGGEPTLVARPGEQPAAPAQPEGDEDQVRTTVRLPTYLRADVESAAKGAGVSINTWIVDAVRAALSRRPPRPPMPPKPDLSGPGLSGWFS